MLLRELQHENIVPLDSVHIHRAEPCLWLAFDYADHDLYEMIRFHRDQAHNPRVNPFGTHPRDTHTHTRTGAACRPPARAECAWQCLA